MNWLLNYSHIGRGLAIVFSFSEALAGVSFGCDRRRSVNPFETEEKAKLGKVTLQSRT